MEEELPLPARWAVQLLGPPLLTLPFVVHEIGYGQALIQLAAAIGLSWAGFHCIVEAAHYTMAHSLRELVEKLSGRRLGLVVQAAACLFDVGRAAGLLAVSSDALVRVVRYYAGESTHFLQWEAALGLSGLCFLLCLVPGEKTGGLRKVFSASGLFVLTLVFVVLARFAQAAGGGERMEIAAFPGGVSAQFADFFKYCPTFLGLYAVHDALPAQLQRVPGPPAPKKRAVRALLAAAVLVSTLAYGVVGALAGAVFGAENAPNVFDALLGTPGASEAAGTARGFLGGFYAVYAALLAVGAPLTLGPLRGPLSDLFHGYGPGWGALYSFLLSFSAGGFALIPSVLELAGLVAAFCGFFACALLAFYRLPELRAKYRFMDQVQYTTLTRSVPLPRTRPSSSCPRPPCRWGPGASRAHGACRPSTGPRTSVGRT